MLLMSAAACGRHATVPFVPDSLIEAAPARLNIVLYLSSCTPCGSLTFDEAADFVRVNRQSSRMLVVVNRNAGSAEALLRERIGGADGVTFRRDTDGRIARSAAVPSLPFLVIYDNRHHLLRAEAIAASDAAHACLHDEIVALYTVPVS